MFLLEYFNFGKESTLRDNMIARD